MTATDGNIYDNGIITFSGESIQGTYRQVNVYQIEYQGDFRLSGNDLVLSSDETWEGTIVDANHLSGTSVAHLQRVENKFSERRSIGQIFDRKVQVNQYGNSV